MMSVWLVSEVSNSHAFEKLALSILEDLRKDFKNRAYATQDQVGKWLLFAHIGVLAFLLNLIVGSDKISLLAMQPPLICFFLGLLSSFVSVRLVMFESDFEHTRLLREVLYIAAKDYEFEFDELDRLSQKESSEDEEFESKMLDFVGQTSFVISQLSFFIGSILTYLALRSMSV
ncbi:MAG: hypothetical protein AAGI89_05190 [Pseudomonadota bacterium]